MFKVVIADDEPLAREGLALNLQPYPDFQIVASCADGYQALDAVEQHRPDILFMDIRMPGLSGFDALAMLDAPRPAVVFVTAFDRYAVQAFEAHALDYLLKPLDPARLDKTIRRLRDHWTTHKKNTDHLLYTLAQEQPVHMLAVREDGVRHIIRVEEITHISARGDYVRIHTTRRDYSKKERLARLQEKLAAAGFIRIHRSHLLNRRFLEHLEEGPIAVLETGQRLPVSRNGYKVLNRLLKG